MSYQVLARKWRPQKFSQLVGQEHVVNAITNALENNKLHHAYLFTGTRGVGKTTIARIFSKSLNCEQGQTANPCGECPTCIDISDGRYVDLLEIDAASRTKVEDTRELLDNVQYRPTRGKYKVYLIDEVHMLSKHSFNALLKTLEEPPEHVKFLLATTDPQKLPVTILSRCLQFNLKALSKEQIHNHLAFILKQESIDFENPAIEQLSKAAQGSIRDSLSLTDQAIAQGNNKVTFKVVANMLGLLNRNQLIRLLKFICERNGINSLEVLQDICSQSPDYTQILSQLLALIHQVALTQIVPDICKLENDSARAIYTLSKSLSEEHVQVLYQIGVNGIRDLTHAPDTKTGLEMTILRMLAFSPVQSVPINLDDLKASDTEFESELSISSSSETLSSESKEEPISRIHLQDQITPSERTKESSEQEVIKNTNSEPSTDTNSFVQPEENQSESDGSSYSDVSQEIYDETKSDFQDESSDSANGDDSNSTLLYNKNEQDHEEKLIVESDTLSFSDSEVYKNFDQSMVANENTENRKLSFGNESFGHDLFTQIDAEPIQSEQQDEKVKQEDSVNRELDKSEQSSKIPGNTSKSSYMRTLELLRAEKEIDEITGKDELQQDKLASDVEVLDNGIQEPQTDFELGQALKQFEGDLPAYLKNGDKLICAAQLDSWSAFVDSTSLQAYSRVFLLNTNCQALTNPLKLIVSEDNYKMCTSEVQNNIEEKLSSIFNQKIELIVEKGNTKNTPYDLQQRIKDRRLAHAREIVNTDNNIQELKKAFDADVLQNSIEVRPKK